MGDRNLGSLGQELAGTLPTELGLLTALTKMLEHHTR